MTKRLQTIALAALLLDEETISEEKDHKKTKKDHTAFKQGLNEGKKKKAVNAIFIRNFE